MAVLLDNNDFMINRDLKFSIIVPVYNAAPYLHRCINSLLVQNCKHFELLLINDGSTDDSGKICDTYVDKDTRVRVIHQKNQGVSVSRNKGIEKARGEFVVFCDSDDEVTADYLTAFDTTTDFCQTGCLQIKDKTITECHIRSQSYSKDVAKTLIKKGLVSFPPWGKCFKNSILQKNKVRFMEGIHLGEDVIFLYNYLYYCKSACLVDKCTYKYHKRTADSLSTMSHSEDMMKQKWIYEIEMLERIFKNDIRQMRYLVYWGFCIQHEHYKVTPIELLSHPFFNKLAINYLSKRQIAKMKKNRGQIFHEMNNVLVRRRLCGKIANKMTAIFCFLFDKFCTLNSSVLKSIQV